MSPQRRSSIPYPAPDDLDAAPQMLVVALADAALLAVERALDSAHPILAATRLPNPRTRLLLSTESVAVQVLDATAQLAALLREYLDSVRFDLADLDDDIADPF
ncbi:MAG TPA: hypothetical protein VMI75_26710 [Polyangiaceae bacterium]|nr:hypothetical protein [Polyangiaceae bacterium]